MSNRRDPFLLSQIPIGTAYFLTPTSKEEFVKQSITADRMVYVPKIQRYKLTIKYDKHRARRTYTIEESGNLGVTWFANKERVYDGYALEYLFNIINKNNEK